MTSLGATFTTTVGVVDRVHCGTAHLGAAAQPTRPTGLTNGLVFVFLVPNLADRCRAVLVNLPQLAQGQPEQAQLALFGHHLRV